MCGGSGARPEASSLADGIVCCIRVDGWRGSAGQQCGWESAAHWPDAESPAVASITGVVAQQRYHVRVHALVVLKFSFD